MAEAPADAGWAEFWHRTGYAVRSGAKGAEPGLTTEEQKQLKEQERETRELRRANEILRKASAFFAGQHRADRRSVDEGGEGRLRSLGRAKARIAGET